ncbi:unnamed protein product [Rotaria magnacalcarata]|nr:unnamed protein product [Rotaria magnacalcarata]CAF4008525.1 unnamed protein product [Rotaria magnacalcarata]CAF4063180.1 unnamed protein product [Rotaria magnacalcarata]
MGCAQPSTSVLPQNHIPIERLYDSRGYPLMRTSPTTMITAAPIPSYVKSALKKTAPYETLQTDDRNLFRQRKPFATNKTVNFDEQVLVKARTPTPNKSWYEKKSSTMPMRHNPRNDDDDDDYDNDEEEEEEGNDDEVYSDEEQESNEHMDKKSYIPRLGTPTTLIKGNQPNAFWSKTNAIGFTPSTASLLRNESFPLNTQQQHNFHRNTSAAENPIASSGNRIKVRRRLPQFGPPQILPDSPYESLRQSSGISLYQSIAQPSAFTVRRSAAQLSTVFLHQSPGPSSTISAFRIPQQASLHLSTSLQPKTTAAQQLPSQPSSISAYHLPAKASVVSAYQYPPVQPQTGSTQLFSVQNSIAPSYQSISAQAQTSSLHQYPLQTSLVSAAQIPTQPSMAPSVQHLPIPTHQISLQPSSETVHVQQTLPNTKSVPIEQQSSLTKSEPSLSTIYNVSQHRRTENVT